MRIFTEKSFRQKLIIAIVCVLLLNFSFASTVRAETTFGGTMMSYLRDFVKAVADVFGSVVQLGMTGKWIYAVDKEGTGIPSTDSEYSDYWIKSSYFEYPILQISPEVIFAGEVQMLDINFIRPISSKAGRISSTNG